MTLTDRYLRRECNPGFTVLELVIAIGIVAALAILGLSAVQRGVGISNSVKCMGNMRQVWSRMLIYVNENRGSFPYAHKVEGYRFWPQEINDAAGVSDLKVYICPSVKKADLNRSLRELRGGYAYVSYGINFYGISASTNTIRQDAPAKISDLKYPAKTLALIDCDDLGQPYDGWYIAYGGRLRDQWESVSKRHDGRLNTVFCDGHAEFVTKEELYVNPLNEEPWAQFIYLRPRE